MTKTFAVALLLLCSGFSLAAPVTKTLSINFIKFEQNMQEYAKQSKMRFSKNSGEDLIGNRTSWNNAYFITGNQTTAAFSVLSKSKNDKPYKASFDVSSANAGMVSIVSLRGLYMFIQATSNNYDHNETMVFLKKLTQAKKGMYKNVRYQIKNGPNGEDFYIEALPT